jgi:L-seryl-tRNA(Ser) seleniumtransferase
MAQPWSLSIQQQHSRELALEVTRSVLENLRELIRARAVDSGEIQAKLQRLPIEVAEELKRLHESTLVSVINATGVILHTNLGRAPLSRHAIDRIVCVAQGYCNLEFDLDSGRRGRRDEHVERQLLAVLAIRANIPVHTFQSAYRAVIVNNCAAATFLVLNSLASSKEVLVSRGELVEIGGGFRIPEILEKSGAKLREVGTTNKTRIKDYSSAITENSGLILRVHQANFCMTGFVERPLLSELIELGRRSDIAVFEDQGTGAIASIKDFAVADGANLSESCKMGVDIIAASGDKLFGGPQAGIILGKSNLVDLIVQNPLLRILRPDKLTYAALQATIRDYLDGHLQEIPIYRMLGTTRGELRQRASQIAASLNRRQLSLEVVEIESVVGGGTTPSSTIPSIGLAIRGTTRTAGDTAALLRKASPPIIARVEDNAIVLDLRTVLPELDTAVSKVLDEVLA